MCVCLSVHLCVSATNLNNLWHVCWMVAKFSGPANLLTSNFWAGDLAPGPPGSGPDPKNGVSAKSNSSEGFEAGVAPFQNRDYEANKRLGAEFWFLAHGRRKPGLKARLAMGRPKFWNFYIFFEMGPPKIRLWLVLFFCKFLIRRTLRVPGVPRSREVWKSKVKIGVFLQKGTP